VEYLCAGYDGLAFSVAVRYSQRDMFNLYHLQIFQMVAEEGNISRAAERLFLTQPAVSQHVRALEADLGVRLFQRGARGVKLTPAGEVLLDYTRCLLRLADEARQAAARAGGIEKSQVRIGASPGVGVFLLPKWIHSFHERYPALSVTLKTAPTPTIVQAIADKQIEIGIVEGELENAAVEATPLWDEEIAVVVGQGHPWWGQESIEASAMSGQGFIVREEGSLTRAWEEHSLETHGVAPRIVAEFDTPVAIKQAVMSGLGIALLPSFAIQQELRAGLLHAPRLMEGPLVRTLRLLWAQDSLAQAVVQAFVGHLSGEFPHLPLQLSGDAEIVGLLPRLQGLGNSGAAGAATDACRT
jgi:DNA-binding transcriptional LysR family regulator